MDATLTSEQARILMDSESHYRTDTLCVGASLAKYVRAIDKLTAEQLNDLLNCETFPRSAFWTDQDHDTAIAYAISRSTQLDTSMTTDTEKRLRTSLAGMRAEEKITRTQRDRWYAAAGQRQDELNKALQEIADLKAQVAQLTTPA